MTSSLPRPSSTSTRSSSPLDRVLRRLRQAHPPFLERPLAWEDAVVLAGRLGLDVELRRIRQDAYVTARFGRPRILINERLFLPTWGVYCVVHELAHFLTHPGRREYYLGSPGWLGKIESQANQIALLALWPRPAPYPQILQITEEGVSVTLHLALTTPSAYDLGARWTSRRLTLRRYER